MALTNLRQSAMALTPYTSSAEIRAALGVSKTELSDVTLALPMYSELLNEALESFSPKLVPMYETIVGLGIAASSDQKRFLRVMNLYATYAMAAILLSSLPMFSVKSLTDGKAEFERQTDIYEDLRSGITGMLAQLAAKLATILELLDPEFIPTVFAPPTIFLVSIPDSDPVTGA